MHLVTSTVDVNKYSRKILKYANMCTCYADFQKEYFSAYPVYLLADITSIMSFISKHPAAYIINFL